MRAWFVQLIMTLLVFTQQGWSQPTNLPGELKWRARATNGSAWSAGPTLGTNGLVYSVAHPVLYAWDVATGQLRWATNFSGFVPADAGALVVGPQNHVYLNTRLGLRAFHGESGAELWTSPVHGPMAVGGDGTVYVISETTYGLYALRPDSGATNWSAAIQAYPYTPPAIAANGLLIMLVANGGYDAQTIVALDAGAGAGQVRWSFTAATSAAFTHIALAEDGTVLAGGRNGHVYAIDGATGKKLWSFQGRGEISDLIIATNALFAIAYRGQGSLDCAVHVHEVHNSNLVREMSLPYAKDPRIALTADGTLYVAPYEYVSGPSRFLALDFATGHTNWSVEVGAKMGRVNVGRDGTVYVEGDGLMAFHGSSPLADGPWPKAQQNAQNTSFWKVTGPPLITRQPQSHWGAAGMSTAFHFYSPVMRPLHIQWRLNGQSIPGATNESLVLSSVQFSNAGLYSVLLSNQFGSVLSDEATLSVGYALEVTVDGPGIVQRTPDLEIYPTNSVVELRAIITRSNHTFVGWSGAIESSATPITLTLSSNLQLTATFEYLYPDVKWTSYFGEAPAIGLNGVLYAHAGYAMIALDTATGTNIWETGSGDGWWAPPAITSDGTVYVGDYGGSSIWALDGVTGEKKGGFNVGICVHSCPTIGVDGTLYLAGTKIFAVTPVTHQEKWSFEGAGIFESSPALGSDGVLYAGCYDGKMYALNTATGGKLWEFVTGGMVHSSPALDADGNVYFGSADYRLYALDGRTGQKLWDFVSSGPISGSPIVGSNGCVYFGSEDNIVYALDPTGETKWYFVTGGRITSSPLLTADGTLYISSVGAGLYAINSKTGQKLWQFPGFSSTPAVGPDGTIYYEGSAIHGTSPLADTPWPKLHRTLDNRGRAHARPVLDREQSRYTPEGFAITVHSEPGDRWTLEATTNWLDWEPLDTITTDVSPVLFVDTNATTLPRRFYRTR
jgi:outer membrane protein assembly factor BamB